MAIIATEEVLNFDSSFRKFTLYYTITLESGETINKVMVVSSSPTWFNVKNSTITNYSTEIEIKSNNTFEIKEATITITVTTNGGTTTKTVNIIQDKFKTYPIWANKVVRIETQENSVNYNINYKNETIYAGKAYVMPSTEYVEIDISKICSSYLNSTLENSIDAPQVYNAQDGVGLFSLYVNEELHSTYLFYNSYSYKVNPPYTQDGDESYIVLSEPIRKVFDSRQYIVYSFFNVLNTSSYYFDFYFHKNQYTHSTVSDTLNGRTQYTTMATVPDGFDTVQFFQEYIPIKDTCCKYCLYYQNALGGWDSFLINGNDKQIDKITSYKYIKSVDNTTRKFGTKKYLNMINSTYRLYTDWMNDDEASRMHHLLESTEVYMHNLEDGTIIPVNITNNTCEYKTYSNNGKKKFYYEIDVEFAQHKVRQ